MIVVRNGRIRTRPLGYLMPYGNAVYNTLTGRYEIPGQAGSYATTAELNAALVAEEIEALRLQEPEPTSVMIGPYAGYPVGEVRTLPGGVQIPEATYQLALAQGTLPQLIQSYLSHPPTQGALPSSGQQPQTYPKAPTAYHPSVSLTNLSRPGQAAQVGDSLRVTITSGPPNQPVTATAIHNGDTSTSQLGTTDAAGSWSKDVQMSAGEIGHWVEHWRVGNTPVTPALTFDVSAVVPAAPPTTPPPSTPAAETSATTGGGGAAAGTAAQVWEQITSTVQKVPWWGWAAGAGALLFFRKG